MTDSDFVFFFKKLSIYRGVNGWLLGDWPDKVGVFRSPSGEWREQWADRGVPGRDRAPWRRAKLQESAEWREKIAQKRQT